MQSSLGKLPAKQKEPTLLEQWSSDLTPECVVRSSITKTKTTTHPKPLISTPLHFPDQDATHRAVTTNLHQSPLETCSKADTGFFFNFSPSSPPFDMFSNWSQSASDETQSNEFSPTSSQFLAPPDYEALFSGQQSLGVSECSQVSLTDLSPVSPVFSDSSSDKDRIGTTNQGAQGPLEPVKVVPGEAEDFQFSPDFNKVLSEFEKSLSAFEPEHSKPTTIEASLDQETTEEEDEDLEFFDCKQSFSPSDTSDPNDLGPEDLEMAYHVSEPPSPLPSSLDAGIRKESPVYTGYPFLRVDDRSRFSSGSESLGDFAYDSDHRSAGAFPMCEELPARGHEGFEDDDDDSLGRVRGSA